jgi:hypothetical protein
MRRAIALDRYHLIHRKMLQSAMPSNRQCRDGGSILPNPVATGDEQPGKVLRTAAASGEKRGKPRTTP